MWLRCSSTLQDVDVAVHMKPDLTVIIRILLSLAYPTPIFGMSGLAPRRTVFYSVVRCLYSHQRRLSFLHTRKDARSEQ